jgi:hypothetical protein
MSFSVQTTPEEIMVEHLERELEQRNNDGIDVRLVWRPLDESLVVIVDDERSGESFRLKVEPADAHDVFEHPYAYAAWLELAVA